MKTYWIKACGDEPEIELTQFKSITDHVILSMDGIWLTPEHLEQINKTMYRFSYYKNAKSRFGPLPYFG